MKMLIKLLIITMCFILMSLQSASTTPHRHHNHDHQHDHNHHHNHDHKHDHSHNSRNIANNEADDENTDINETLEDEFESDKFCEWDKCDKDKDLREPRGFSKYLDLQFLKKLVKNLNPFSKGDMQMRYFLFKKDFSECGHEIFLGDNSIFTSGLNATHPTRIVVHGWMSGTRGSFNRDVKNAYLSRGDYNVIVADWSASATNLNYFSVVKMIEGFGEQLAKFTTYLHDSMQVNYDDIYVIGHSLGAQIAGAAGKRLKPAQYNTIFALDPAGPKFRKRSIECRIDPTDAKYVESMQTSANLGFLEPTGSATFYPNYGYYQRKCYYLGCSHIRAYKMFAESIVSKIGFWGTRCQRSNKDFECSEQPNDFFRMGGEPSVPKAGIFYVKTGTSEPFALGRNITV
ncbi:phospholipase A1 [Teleopsis dalmanni]|uniref:phospholipase A1 n=1 Tax=Teleopsis dalmanni TaxID=139649 RepID=UPI0018CEC98B|nr:phospholipase A1 [Teleopsis dalmanni]